MPRGTVKNSIPILRACHLARYITCPGNVSMTNTNGPCPIDDHPTILGNISSLAAHMRLQCPPDFRVTLFKMSYGGNFRPEQHTEHTAEIAALNFPRLIHVHNAHCADLRAHRPYCPWIQA